MLRISSFSIDGLNGLFHYQDCSAPGSLSDLMILYGDNGSGKTTILNLIFHLLSPQSGRGHLNAIARVPFKSLKVNLSDNTCVSAERTGNPTGFPIIFRIARQGAKATEYIFIPEDMRNAVIQEFMERELSRQKQGQDYKKRQNWERFYKTSELISPFSFTGPDDDKHKKYISVLQEINLKVYLMSTDRRIRCDSIAEVAEVRQSSDRARARDDIINQARATYLTHALGQASRFINRQLISATDKGSKNTNDIYAELIGRIAAETTNSESGNITESINNSITKLGDLEIQNKNLASLGIAPALDFASMINSVGTSSIPSQPFLDKVLRPYIDSLNAQYAALNPIGDVLKTFLSLLNALFKFKSLSFSPKSGFVINGFNGEPLEPEQLSSGEQQLLLIFCYLLVATEDQSIFMIDEPEISLNIKWQRELIDAMREINKNSKTQIIIATHSIELLTQYSDMVVQLEPIIPNNARPLYESTKEEN